MNRQLIADELLRELFSDDADYVDDHQRLASMLIAGSTSDAILQSPECDRWPETYVWLKAELTDAST